MSFEDCQNLKMQLIEHVKSALENYHIERGFDFNVNCPNCLGGFNFKLDDENNKIRFKTDSDSSDYCTCFGNYSAKI
jgi:hypothetical protein